MSRGKGSGASYNQSKQNGYQNKQSGSGANRAEMMSERIKYSGGYLLLIGLLCTGACQREVRPLSLNGDLGGAPPADLEAGVDQSGARRSRVVFMVDVSQSLLRTDPFELPDSPSARQRAAAEVVQQLAGEDAAFGFILLRQVLEINAGLQGGWVRDPLVLDKCLSSLSQGAGLSDWQSAVAEAGQMVQQDIQGSSQEELARTTYDLILAVDGLPLFECAGGCAGGDGGPCEPGQCVPCDAGLCPSEVAKQQPEICYTPRSRWCEDGVLPNCANVTEVYPHLNYCEGYNTQASLEGLAAEISSLSQVARIRLHVVLLPGQEQALVDQMRPALISLAARGQGTYLEVKELSQLSFLPLLGEGE